MENIDEVIQMGFDPISYALAKKKLGRGEVTLDSLDELVRAMLVFAVEDTVG